MGIFILICCQNNAIMCIIMVSSVCGIVYKNVTSGTHKEAEQVLLLWPVSGIFSVLSQFFLNYFSFPSYFSLISLKFPRYFSVISPFQLFLTSHLLFTYFSLLTCFSLISQLFLDFSLASQVFLTCFSITSHLFLIYVFANLSHFTT